MSPQRIVRRQYFVSVLCPTYVRTNIGKDTIGSENEKKYSEILADSSPISADEVAQTALKSMVEEKLYIILPNDARFLWRLKRFMPERYWRIIKKVTEKEIVRLQIKLKEKSAP